MTEPRPESLNTANTSQAGDRDEFLRHAIKLATFDKRLCPGGILNAQAICRVILELAVDFHGEAGKDVLLDWNLGTSEQVGVAVRAIQESQSAFPTEHVPVDSYREIFDLALPPSTWKLKW